MDDAVYVYGAFEGKPACEQVKQRLEKLPLRPTVILSLEQGPELVLDRAGGEELVACALRSLRQGRPRRSVKALVLQDPSFAGNANLEALRRIDKLAAFARRNRGLLAGAQVDIEPYTSEQWGCCTIEDRRALMREMHKVLGEARLRLRPLPLGVVAPWWYAAARDLPEAAPAKLLEVADEIVLMAYGDEGGPLVGGTAARILERVDQPNIFPEKGRLRGRLHIALATYEFPSPDRLESELAQVRERLRRRHAFGGTAVFHAASAYDAKLLRFAGGVVADSAGKPLAGVEITSGTITAKSNGFGEFSLRGLGAEPAKAILRKDGFRERAVDIRPPAPGEQIELGTIKLDKN